MMLTKVVKKMGKENKKLILYQLFLTKKSPKFVERVI